MVSKQLQNGWEVFLKKATSELKNPTPAGIFRPKKRRRNEMERRVDPDDNKSYSWEELRCPRRGWKNLGGILEEFGWFISWMGWFFGFAKDSFETFWTQKFRENYDSEFDMCAYCFTKWVWNKNQIVLNWFIMTLEFKSTIKRIISPVELLMKLTLTQKHWFFSLLDHSKNR